MTNDLAKTIAAACLEAIQSRPDTPGINELAEVVRPMLADHEDEKYRIARETAYRIAQEQMQQAPEWMRDAKKRAWATDDALRVRTTLPSISTQELHDARHQRMRGFMPNGCPCSYQARARTIGAITAFCPVCGAPPEAPKTPEAGDA